MLGGLLGWVSLILDPITNYAASPIQPQDRLLPKQQQRPRAPWQDILTGVRDPPALVIHDREGVKRWTFERDRITQDLPPDVHRCIHDTSHEADEVKYMKKGKSIASVFSKSVIVVSHTPENPATDKLITFALCRLKNEFRTSHSVEPLPGDRLAVATSDQRSSDGIVVFNASAANPLTGSPEPLQTIRGFPTVHSMVWDEEGQMLWAAGTDVAADGSDKIPANVTIMAFPWDAETGLLRDDDRQVYKLRGAHDLDAEWGKGSSWWAGGHDLSPIPGERKLLLSEDRGLHVFDIGAGQFTDRYQKVADKYLPGFETIGQRRGNNSRGQVEEWPHSDIKSINLALDGSFIYVQALWGRWRGNATNVVVNGHRHEIDFGSEIYRSRWFEDIYGWPKP